MYDAARLLKRTGDWNCASVTKVIGVSEIQKTENDMIRGALSHLDLTMTDPERSLPFYDAVLSTYRKFKRHFSGGPSGVQP